MSEITPLTPEEGKRVKELLAEVQWRYKYVPFTEDLAVKRLAFPLPLSIFFKSQSEEDRRLLIRWAETPENFSQHSLGALHQTLRVIHGFSCDDLASHIEEKIGKKINTTSIRTNENTNVFSESYKEMLIKYNIFNLSDPKIIEELWAKDKLEKQESKIADERIKTLLQNERLKKIEEAPVADFFHYLEMEIEEYKAGNLPLASTDEHAPQLVTRNEAVRQLLRVKNLTARAVSKKVFSRKNADYLSDCLTGVLEINNDVLHPVMEVTGIKAGSKEWELLERLPYKTGNTILPFSLAFSEPSCKEMTAPIIKNILKHPERYDTLKDWFQALRSASQQSRRKLSKTFPRSFGTLRRTEERPEVYLKKEYVLDSFFADNILNLPEGPDKKILPDAWDQFKNTPAFFEERQNNSLQTWEETKAELDVALSRFRLSIPEAGWQECYHELLAQTEGVNKGSVHFEGRSVTVQKRGDRLHFKPGDIEALTKDRLFLQRLATNYRGPEGAEIGQKPSL